MNNSSSSDTSENYLPPPKRNAWIVVFATLAFIAAATLVLRHIYRDSVKNRKQVQSLVTKRTTPALFTNYTLVFAPVDEHVARRIGSDIIIDIGKDSAVTHMVVASTLLYHHTSSLREYRDTIYRAATQSRQADASKQSLLFAQLAGVILQDTLPVRLNLVGRLSTMPGDTLLTRFGGTARDLGFKNERFNNVQVVSYMTEREGSPESALHRAFRDRGIAVELRQ